MKGSMQMSGVSVWSCMPWSKELFPTKRRTWTICSSSSSQSSSHSQSRFRLSAKTSFERCLSWSLWTEWQSLKSWIIHGSGHTKKMTRTSPSPSTQGQLLKSSSQMRFRATSMSSMLTIYLRMDDKRSMKWNWTMTITCLFHRTSIHTLWMKRLLK